MVVRKRVEMANTRHGMSALKSRVKLRGMEAIDKRTGPARSMLEWRDQYIRDLGGPENVTAAKMKLVECAATTAALISHADAFLMEQPSVINRRKKSFYPLVPQKQSLVDSLARLLNLIGLDRVPKPIPTLQEVCAEIAAKRDAAAASDEAETGPGDQIPAPEGTETQEEEPND